MKQPSALFVSRTVNEFLNTTVNAFTRSDLDDHCGQEAFPRSNHNLWILKFGKWCVSLEGARFGSSGSQYHIDDIPTSSYFATTSCVTVVGLSRFPNRIVLKESLFRRPLSSIASK